MAFFKQIFKRVVQIVLPLLLGGMILWWVYKDFEFSRVGYVMTDVMDWKWMMLSLLFGVLGHVIRGVRWKLTLAPIGEYPKTSHCIYAIFFSYAANLVVPRIGEVSRCGVLRKYDGTSFSKALGTVVSERLVDTLCVLIITGFTLLAQRDVLLNFFAQTGTRVPDLKSLLLSVDFYIILICIVAIVILLYFLVRRLSIFGKVKNVLKNIWEGILSLKKVQHLSLFIAYTIGIWLCYFLEFYVAVFCFPFTGNIGVMAALLLFVVGSIAVIVPTPNGAGPWHFAIITMMVLLGVSREDAGIFALIVHGIQTFLLILLGVYAMVALSFVKSNLKNNTL